MASMVLVAGAVVTLWALASPSRDVVGQLVSWSEARWTELRAWYISQPLDGELEWDTAQLQVRGADAAQGPALMVAYGCGSCHVIPGVSGARGTVGPSLTRFGERAYIAGILPNGPGTLTNWLINPPLYAPQTAMPDMGITQEDAEDMAAYLLALGHDR
ncbi:c-type cytochrome [Pseudaestuariivita sp.]|uniref:c-type cytochrome n=1 Tax=Pseudaestuariivita sp. TaxID=2211669 RepID=UPI004059F97A